MERDFPKDPYVGQTVAFRSKVMPLFDYYRWDGARWVFLESA